MLSFIVFILIFYVDEYVKMMIHQSDNQRVKTIPSYLAPVGWKLWSSLYIGPVSAHCAEGLGTGPSQASRGAPSVHVTVLRAFVGEDSMEPSPLPSSPNHQQVSYKLIARSMNPYQDSIRYHSFYVKREKDGKSNQPPVRLKCEHAEVHILWQRQHCQVWGAWDAFYA